MRYPIIMAVALVLAPAGLMAQGKPSRRPCPPVQQSASNKQDTQPDVRGTPAAPLVVKVLDSTEAKQPAAEAAKEREAKAATDTAIVRLTGGLVLVGFLQLLLFGRQLWIMGRSLRDTKTAAEAARDGVALSKVSMIAGDRAYVHYGGCRYLSHRDLSDNSLFWTLRVSWINHGNTPTRRFGVVVHFELRDAILPDDYPIGLDETVVPTPTTIAPHSGVESGIWNIEAEDLAAVARGKKHLYIWGVARYRDVFPDTPDRVTKLALYAYKIFGDPMKRWDEKTNPLEIKFLHYKRHNCADEDCEEPPPPAPAPEGEPPQGARG